MPHVLLSADAVGGVWTYALDLAAMLAAEGVRVTLAVLGPAPTAAQRRAAEALPGLSLVALDAPLDWTATDLDALRVSAAALASLAAQLAPDLVQLNAPALASLARFNGPVLGVCHSCVGTWWATVRGGAPPPDLAWRRALVAQGYAACDALVAPSEAFAAATETIYGVRPQVVRNGRRAPAPRPGARPRFVLAVGRLWDEGKDMATLNRAAARLDAPVVALGPLAAPGGAPVSLPALRTPGARNGETVACWMARAPVFASAAIYEPFGLAVLEAAQAGAALVLADTPVFRELWDGAAAFVTPGDAEGFAEAARRLLADEPGRTRLAALSQARARDYDAAAVAQGMLAQYRRLAPDAFRVGRKAA